MILDGKARTPKELEAEFDRLYLENEKMVYDLAWRLTGNEEAAKDIRQKTFLTLHRKLKKVLRHPAPEGWFFKTVHYFVKHYKRSVAYKSEHELPLSEAELIAVPPMHGNELESFRGSLPSWVKDIDKELLTLHFYYGYNLKEISVKLGLTHGAARSRMARLIQKLRESGYGKSGEGSA